MFDRIRYNIKKPGNGRATFAIVKDIIRSDGSRTTETMKDERITALNALHSRGLKSAAVVELELKAMVKAWHEAEEKRRGTIVYNEDNERILEDLWRHRYEDKDIVSPASARRRLRRGVKFMGPISLVSTDRETLQKLLNRRLKGNRHRAMAAVLNQLLRYAGRDIKLLPARAERRRINHLTPEEFDRVIKKVKDPVLKLFYAASFATGGRSGEVFALTEVKDGVVYIASQIDEQGLERHTKNRRERSVVVNPKYMAEVEEWIVLEGKDERRTERLAEALSEASIKAVGRPCTVKDLRHSYAIWLLTQGVSLSLVAQSLGNSIQVCQEYYAGFVLAPDSVTAIKSVLGSRGETGRRIRLKI